MHEFSLISFHLIYSAVADFGCSQLKIKEISPIMRTKETDACS